MTEILRQRTSLVGLFLSVGYFVRYLEGSKVGMNPCGV